GAGRHRYRANAAGGGQLRGNVGPCHAPGPCGRAEGRRRGGRVSRERRGGVCDGPDSLGRWGTLLAAALGVWEEMRRDRGSGISEIRKSLDKVPILGIRDNPDSMTSA